MILYCSAARRSSRAGESKGLASKMRSEIRRGRAIRLAGETQNGQYFGDFLSALRQTDHRRLFEDGLDHRDRCRAADVQRSCLDLTTRLRLRRILQALHHQIADITLGGFQRI